MDNPSGRRRRAAQNLGKPRLRYKAPGKVERLLINIIRGLLASSTTTLILGLQDRGFLATLFVESDNQRPGFYLRRNWSSSHWFIYDDDANEIKSVDGEAALAAVNTDAEFWSCFRFLPKETGPGDPESPNQFSSPKLQISLALLLDSQVLVKMESQKSQVENQSIEPTTTALAAGTTPTPPSAAATPTSCRKKKNEQATFLEDVKDHIDEFIHASMDEHVSCFKKTIDKMFKMSKVVAEKNAADAKGVESSLPLQTTVAD
ncbi:hypothetical protein ACLB2K_011787 [Fragaria x ananassa]